MLIRLLGPVDVVDDQGNIHVSSSAIRRSLLALLAIHAGRVLSADWLLEHAWNGRVPDSGRRALRFHISQLRHELAGLDLVETCPGGYRLRVAPDEVDTGAVESLGREARQETDSRRAVDLCRQALDAWRGEPFVDASPTSDLADEAARLGELRLALTELSCQRRLDSSDGADLIADLVRLTAENPLRERLWQVLIAAQYRAGRQADALRSYDAARSILIETLGIEPSAELRELHHRVLSHDPTLDVRRRTAMFVMMWDVEGTTGLLVRRGQAGLDTLATVTEMVAAVADQRGGRVSTVEDEAEGAVVLFARIGDAFDTAIELNRRLALHPWSETDALAIRIAVHVGAVTAPGDRVLGSAVQWCARLRALAEGGEVLLSEEAAMSAAQTSAGDWSLVDGGPLIQGSGERAWRLVHPALRSRDLSLGADPTQVSTLPTWRTSFVGRSRDVATIRALLAVSRLVTLVGPAGVGKTRLAATVAANTPGRVCFVDLSIAARDSDVDAMVAEALGSRMAAAPRDGIEAALQKVPALLVLDNCEHVLDAVASLAEFMRTECDASSVLATSRAALRLADEEVFSVQPLPTGADGGAAVQLFIDRAGAARAFAGDDRVLADIDALTALLDGVPLAIELAAAQTAAYSVREILGLLQRDLAGLGDALRRGPDRHRTLRSAIESSMRILSDDERRLFCRLAVLPGTYRLSTAIAVAAIDEGDERRLIAAMPVFVEQSLMSAEYRDGPTRYRMLEMIRSVAQDGLDSSDCNAVLDGLLIHCLDQLKDLDTPDPPEAGFEEEVSRDTALYRTAMEHAIATGQADLGLDLVYKLFMVWRGRTQRATVDRFMTSLVAMTDTPSSTRAVVLRRQALIAIGDLGDANRAYELLDAAEADAIAMNDGALRGRIQSNRADIDLSLGRDDGIEVRLYDAIALLEEFGDTYFSVTLQTLADLCVTRAKYEEADELLRRAEATEPPWHELLNIKLRRTGLALTRGQVDSASEHAASALDLAERSEEPEFVNSAVLAAAWVALARGEIALAEELCTRTVDQAREHDLFGEMHALVALAIVSVVHGDLALASKCGDGIQEQPLGKSWFGVTDVRLASSFVALAVGEVDRAEDVTMQVLADADREGMPYLRVVSLEMLAAVKASSDPSRAWQLLEDADRMRTAIGAAAWPFEPYRYVALRTLEGHRASIDAPVLGK